MSSPEILDTAPKTPSFSSFSGGGALVTGASRGLGAALARGLAQAGARVVLVARGLETLQRTVDDIRATAGEAHALSADLADKESIYPLVGAASALVGPIDLLIHNASTLGSTPLRLLLDTECEDFERVLAVNLVGPFRLSRALAGSMALRGRGTIVHISSDAALRPYARWGAYSASKAAQDQLSRVWAEELAAFGVRVLAIDPGEMDTEMHAAAIPDADRTTLANPERVALRILRSLDSGEATTGARLVIPEETPP
jgi:NAD(P)-dependent dehydrogenase (short-subunit alcohol dehydrogenase family)